MLMAVVLTARPPHIEPFLPIVEIAPDQLANSGQSMITKVINTIWAVFKSLPYLPEVFDYFVMPRVHKVSISPPPRYLP
jgi:hypothetical protein